MATPKNIRMVCGDTEITGIGLIEFSLSRTTEEMEKGMISGNVLFDKRSIQVTTIKTNWFVRRWRRACRLYRYFFNRFYKKGLL